MKIAIHQPNFMPYMGFFDKCDYSDILVLYDSTQFKKNDFQNRNRLKGNKGWFWLTIPVSYSFGDPINKVKIDNSKDWKASHLKALQTCYSNSKYFNEYFSKIREIYENEWTYLCDLNIKLIELALDILNIKCKIIKSSEMNVNSKSTQALVDICKSTKANLYVSGKDGKKYVDLQKFLDNQIKVIFQNYQHPQYNQKFNHFEPYMCIFDLIFNEGPNSLNIIKSGRKYES